MTDKGLLMRRLAQYNVLIDRINKHQLFTLKTKLCSKKPIRKPKTMSTR